MENKQIVNKFRNKLVGEAVLRSALWAIVAGCGAAAIVSLVTWLKVVSGGVWISVGVGAGVGLVTGFILYFVKYRPSDDYVAKRMDGAGLDERMITMRELRGDESFMAKLQRQDTFAVVKSSSESGALTTKSVPVKASLVSVICASVIGVVGIAALAVNGLTSLGVLPPVGELFGDGAYADVGYILEYEVDGDGWIKGEIVQSVQPGENGTLVVAVANEGWAFVSWDDGNESPERVDTKLDDSHVYIAIFQAVSPGDDSSDNEGPSNPENSGDQQGKKDEDQPPRPNDSSAGGYGENQSNNVIDGETDYRDVVGGYGDAARQEVSEGELPPEYGDVVGGYFDTLE